ncbi:hypothetical protein D9757_002740 [Collybiopsis confluens]|uniref:U6 snRNA phosphodiesterase n=1 Tax=Collybiopsis confluens TaxID=2823264 RepID=A0A8H5ME84_9AGAR|nr:hypothetical protein D9757_002740 [Collybiopsis confluens]
MKRLVSYSSSDDEFDNEFLPQLPPKKKKLPSLSPSLLVPAPKDDPALHQGRIRSTPHVDGQWASHIYVPIRVESHSAIQKLLIDALETAQKLEPALHPFETGQSFDLHVSLSKPIFLRAHQRQDLKQAVRTLAQKCRSFKLSLTTFSILTNDEKTRTFLALDVGSGHHQLKSLSDDLSPFLSNLRQNEYYADPQFHVSIAWALLATSNAQQPSAIFQAVPQLADTLTVTLNEQFTPASCGAFDVEYLCVKIGKDVSSWRMDL